MVFLFSFYWLLLLLLLLFSNCTNWTLSGYAFQRIKCVIGSSLKYWQAIYGIDLRPIQLIFTSWCRLGKKLIAIHRFRINEHKPPFKHIFFLASVLAHWAAGTHTPRSKLIISKENLWLNVICDCHYKRLDLSNFRNTWNRYSTINKQKIFKLRSVGLFSLFLSIIWNIGASMQCIIDFKNRFIK